MDEYMRYKIGKSPKIGDTRIISRFLFLPMCINGEIRFLEKATYSEMFRKAKDHEYDPYESLAEREGWFPLNWINNEPEIKES